MDVKKLSINRIGLSVRSTNALHRVGVYTVGDMLNYSEDDLLKIRNLGKKSSEEIVERIKEYKAIDENGILYEKNASSNFLIPEDFTQWIVETTNQQMIVDWLKKKNVKIETLELLSARAFNLLKLAGYDYIYQVTFLTREKLMEISRMDAMSAAEIERLVSRYVMEVRDDFFAYMANKSVEDNTLKTMSIHELLDYNQYHDIILQYVEANDIEIERMNLSNRSKNGLISNGYTHMSNIIFMSRDEFQKIPAIGIGSIEEIIEKINEYLAKNESRIMAIISGDESALWDEETIKLLILNLYEDIGFDGLSLNDIVTRLQLPESISIERIKNIIGQLIANKELEYVDYHCYRVYGQFEKYLVECTEIDERSREFIGKRLKGETLEAIANKNGLTRERVRQIVKRDIEKVRNYYFTKTGMNMFDEDYYKYLYETYTFEKKDGTEWFGVPSHVWNYLDLNDVKRGKKDLNEALEDHHGLDAGLRAKIKNYLNRNKLYVDGVWVERRRADLEQLAVRKYCLNDVSFDEFCRLYNLFLEQEEIPYDDEIYYTDAVYRTRKNHLADARFLLWKQKEQMRYYDIDGRDYTELLDVLNLDSYENVELSTVKFMREYPEIMEKYDIRDQYELHNLLRKIIPEGSYHDFRCGRMPEIKFGTFDRDAAIFDILIDSAPISTNDLAEIISEEYGYDPAVVMGSYLQNFSKYYHQGIYSIDQKQMNSENKALLKDILTDDFYYIDEIRHIYGRMIPGADVEEINPYNLKIMGFSVYSRYAVQNHSSLEAFFYDLFTKEDIVDISAYRERFVYVQMFYQKLMELKRSLQVIEFEPNKIISLRKLEQSDITRDMIQNFCDAVYDFVSEKEYFSVKSIKLAGFESELYDLGFSDWFYANLLISDNRFSFGTMFGNIILYKGKLNITIKSFEMKLIREYGCIDTFDLMSELTDKYGCKVLERKDIIYKVQNTDVYYDSILDRLYANKDLYYRELEEGGF